MLNVLVSVCRTAVYNKTDKFVSHRDYFGLIRRGLDSPKASHNILNRSLISNC